MKRIWNRAFVIAVASGLAVAVAAQNNPQPNTKSNARPSAGQNKIGFAELPQRVQQTVRKHAYDSRITTIDRGQLNGEIVYNVTLDNHGRLRQYTFNQNGDMLAEPGRPISEAAGAQPNQPNHSKQPGTGEQHDHHILQHPR